MFVFLFIPFILIFFSFSLDNLLVFSLFLEESWIGWGKVAGNSVNLISRTLTICLSFESVYYRCRTPHQHNKFVIVVDVWAFMFEPGNGTGWLIKYLHQDFFYLSVFFSIYICENFNWCIFFGGRYFCGSQCCYLTNGWFFSSFGFFSDSIFYSFFTCHIVLVVYDLYILIDETIHISS